MEETRSELQVSLQNYKRQNFVFLGPFAFVIFLLLAFVDNGLSPGNLKLFLFLRFLFVLPTLILSRATRKFSLEKIDWAIFISFLTAGIGVSLISYALGGIKSDYYFGLIIVSFVQYAFAPLKRNLAIALDILFFLVFFSLNTIPFDYPAPEVMKQVSNYLSFVILKAIVVRKSEHFFLGALKSINLKKELEHQKTIQRVLGELCHLLNNPLFISMTLLKKLKKENKLQDDDFIKVEKIFNSNERMSKVLKKILELTEKEESQVKLDDLKN